MNLILKKNILILSFFFLFFNSLCIFGVENTRSEKQKEEIISQNFLFSGIENYNVLKNKAITYANANRASLSCYYIEKYIKASLDIDFIKHSQFGKIKDSKPFKLLKRKYLNKNNVWLYLSVFGGSVGFFISFILVLCKSFDKTANLLLSVFIFQLSVFITHSYLVVTNSIYNSPHTLYLSTSMSLLFGPIIYFYFKRLTIKYKFKPIDILHLVPTIILLIFLVPIYILPENEKLRILLNDRKSYENIILISKWVSLMIYGILLIRMYLHSYEKRTLHTLKKNNWETSIVVFCFLHLVLSSIETVLINQNELNTLLLQSQLIVFILFVLYTGFKTYLYPNIFGVQPILIEDTSDNPNKIKISKYEKSGLTERLSIELKEKLLTLLNQDKIYKQNDLTLNKLSELLNTTKHNTSQIINEHFKLNFNKLINSYRIKEAKEILKKNSNSKNFSIIDVAYEVGFNNKVTFNKSFKKINKITPSEYIKSLSLVSDLI